MKKLWADFKKFITRGNVVDMAVGVAVASAFTAIVTAFTKGFISPLLALLTGDSSLDTMTLVIKDPVYDPLDSTVIIEPAVELLWGTFVQKIIDFLIIALVLFLVMRIASAVMAHSKKLRENMINALTHADEEASLAAAKAEEEAKAAAEAAAAAEAKAKAEAEAKLLAEEERKKKELELLAEIRDLLKKQA
ncbi:MAG: large conductance mechanosensitive channel protein MscL [Clostridia bacterium]|nr:large conductance mechanosensitive channel protein MscL [Clostridia bacterium]